MDTLIALLSELQASLLREAQPSLVQFGQLVDTIKAKLLTHKTILNRGVAVRLLVKLIPEAEQQTTMIGFESFRENAFYGAQLKKSGMYFVKKLKPDANFFLSLLRITETDGHVAEGGDEGNSDDADQEAAYFLSTAGTQKGFGQGPGSRQRR